METETVRSGIVSLDEVVQGLRLGDNVVWQVDRIEDYRYFAEPFASQGIRDGRDCVYLRFAQHAAILEPRPGLTIIELDPCPGFDVFSGEVHKIIEQRGKEVCYIFDNLSALVAEWASDELLANFFRVICPYLFELDTIAYFALQRGQHAHSAVARIRDTTQLLINVYHAQGNMYIHPVKVWDRYSSQMFLPHLVSGTRWTPVSESADAARVSSTARRHPILGDTSSIAPWESVYRRLLHYCEIKPDLAESMPEIIALKEELSRMLFGHNLDFNSLADRYFTLQDLCGIRDRLIGSGRIGGKAAGMLLARRILVSERGDTDFSQVLEPHDSFFIGSDVFFTFLVNNDLFRLRLQLTKNPHIGAEEFEGVERRFVAGHFPPEIIEQFRNMLDYFGQAPIIVRSSSLLEDSFGNSFAGKYRSEFCANQGSPEQRLEAFVRAVKLVYASALNPDALSYRNKRGLGQTDEQMAILVQRVSGTLYKDYFFPTLAGVAFSRNLYVWTDRIDPKRGIIRLVFGLGTRAVNRVGPDYPRMIPVSAPQLRPEIGPEIAKYSQRDVDVLDLQENDLVTREIAEVLADRDYPNLYLLTSVMKDDVLTDPFSIYVDGLAKDFVLTFNGLTNRTGFVKIIGDMLATLERAYGYPIDMEFTAFVEGNERVRVNVLQCRPMWVPGAAGPITMPTDVARECTLFRSSRIISAGDIRDIRYIIYIDPRQYAAIETKRKKSLGRLVGRLNRHPRIAESKVVMMGPGRWGTSNIDLGVNVSYADIDNAAVLVEIAREEAGHVPEVSYGTHFFQDLVEAQIIYLPVYPDDRKTEWNEEFFEAARNVLTDFVPDAGGLADCVKVIDVVAATDGRCAQVVADPQSQSAICLLEEQ
jgi:pyruvate,water dikinase